MESREGQAIRLGGLDMLRGVAILAVIMVHTGLRFAGDVYHSAPFMAVVNQGVQLFFLVSAYTMGTMWHARRAEAHPAINFYIRRICRIAPLYWLAILVYGLLLGWQPLPDILANVALVHSLVPSAINSVVPGGWSIGVELFFYLLFPLVVLLPRALLLPLALGWYVLFGLLAEQWLETHGIDPGFPFYSPLTQMPIFLIGLYVHEWMRARTTDLVMIGAGIAILWVALAIVARHAGLPGRPAFWIAIAGMAAALGLVVRYGIAFRPLQWIGQISYSMYLAHFAVLEAVVRLLPESTDAAIAFVPVTALTAAIAFLSFKTGERWSQTLARMLVRRVNHGLSPRPPIPA